jgi:hypothetical protein
VDSDEVHEASGLDVGSLVRLTGSSASGQQ